MCTASVRFVIARDRRRRFRFASLQSELAQRICAEHGQPFCAVTHISKKTLPVLPDVLELLIEKGATNWQVQLGSPMGNMKMEDVVDDDDLLAISHDSPGESIPVLDRVTVAESESPFSATVLADRVTDKVS